LRTAGSEGLEGEVSSKSLYRGFIVHLFSIHNMTELLEADVPNYALAADICGECRQKTEAAAAISRFPDQNINCDVRNTYVLPAKPLVQSIKQLTR